MRSLPRLDTAGTLRTAWSEAAAAPWPWHVIDSLIHAGGGGGGGQRREGAKVDRPVAGVSPRDGHAGFPGILLPNPNRKIL